MFVRAKQKDESRWQVQILESVREGSKVRQKTIRNIGVALNQEELHNFKKIAEAAIVSMKNARNPVLPIFDPFDFHSPIPKKKPVDPEARVKDLQHVQTFNDGIREVFGKVFDDLKLHEIIRDSRKDFEWNAILKAHVLARIAKPESKRAASMRLEQDFGIDIPLEKAYRMMDHVEKQENRIKGRIKQATLSLFEEKVDVLFFDVTTLYFESFTADELRNFGFSKDCKFKETQIVLALVTTKDGMPITYKIFPGNTYEGHTLVDVVKLIKEEFDIDKAIIVADRGMFNEDNLQLLEKENIKYIVSAKLRSFSKAKKQEILNAKNYRFSVMSNEPHWVGEIDHKGRRVVVTYSAKRAKKDRSDRQRLIDRLMKRVKDGKVKLKDVIPNQGTKKFLKVVGGEASVDQDKIANDQEWDGLYGICTNDKQQEAIALLERYRELWTIESAFRLNKHDLKMRPINHWTPKRIKAHIAICFVAYTVVKHTIHRLDRQKIKMSLEQLRQELLAVESMLFRDQLTSKHYILPSHTSPLQRKIYKATGIQRIDKPYSAQ